MLPRKDRENSQEWSRSWRAPWKRRGLIETGRSKKDLSGQSRDEAIGRVNRNVSARELVWVWVLILGLLSTSSVPLDTGLSPSESWFAPL